ncbi:MAG: hypothetical protein QW514_02650 [Thermoprotei archaeon]
MRASRIMILSYLGMAGVPILLWLIAIMSPFNQTATARDVLAFLAALGAIVFGFVGVRDAYVHGK